MMLRGRERYEASFANRCVDRMILDALGPAAATVQPMTVAG
jgi:hypothetical protein